VSNDSSQDKATSIQSSHNAWNPQFASHSLSCLIVESWITVSRGLQMDACRCSLVTIGIEDLVTLMVSLRMGFAYFGVI